MNWRTDPSLDISPSRQIVAKALDAIASNELERGDSLPSVRKMAAEALVNHNTAARAYRELEGLGVVRPENGRGVYITKGGQRIAYKLRQQETLAALSRALEAALRAGHNPEKLRSMITKLQRRIA